MPGTVIPYTKALPKAPGRTGQPRTTPRNIFVNEDGKPACVFCGSQDVKRWDHLIPVKLGGETVIGNMVPACARCDDSKRDLPFEDWMMGNAPQSPKTRGVIDIVIRAERIHA